MKELTMFKLVAKVARNGELLDVMETRRISE